MKCTDGCPYFYYDEYDKYETCHYPDTEPHEWSPCELADEDERRAREEEEWEAFKRQIDEEYDYEV